MGKNDEKTMSSLENSTEKESVARIGTDGFWAHRVGVLYMVKLIFI
jgi:hypothetical protein